MEKESKNAKVNILVEVEGLDKLKDLSDKLKQQAFDIEETVREINFLKLELKINQ